MKLRVLNACASWSGNTLEVSDLIDIVLKEEGFEVFNYDVGLGIVPNPDDFDVMLLGSFTWEEGSTPDDVKDFVADLGVKPSNVYVYGTGDTQFGGDDYFCLAAVKLSKFYGSRKDPLLIEQSPRGSQEKKVLSWAEEVVMDFKINTNKIDINEKKYKETKIIREEVI